MTDASPRTHTISIPTPLEPAAWTELGAPIVDPQSGEGLLDEAELQAILDGIGTEISTVRQADGTETTRVHVLNRTDYIIETIATTYRFGDREVQLETDLVAILPDERAPLYIGVGAPVVPDIVTGTELDRRHLQQMIVYLIDRDEQLVQLIVSRRDDGTLALSVDSGLYRLEHAAEDLTQLLPQELRRVENEETWIGGSVSNQLPGTLNYYYLLMENPADRSRHSLEYDQPIAPDGPPADLGFRTGSENLSETLRILAMELQVDGTYIYYDWRLGRVLRPTY